MQFVTRRHLLIPPRPRLAPRSLREPVHDFVSAMHFTTFDYRERAGLERARTRDGQVSRRRRPFTGSTGKAPVHCGPAGPLALRIDRRWCLRLLPRTEERA